MGGARMPAHMLRGPPACGPERACLRLACSACLDEQRMWARACALRAALSPVPRPHSPATYLTLPCILSLFPPSVSVIGLAGEVHIFRRACDETGGSYGVSLSEQHVSELLLAHASPPPAPAGSAAAELVRMGFPQRAAEDASGVAFVGEAPELLPGGYACPRCKSRAAELPCRCHVCGLALVSSPHLARSYHHLFPVQVRALRTWGQPGCAAQAVSTGARHSTAAACLSQGYQPPTGHFCRSPPAAPGTAAAPGHNQYLGCCPAAPVLAPGLQPFEEVPDGELHALSARAAVADEARAAAVNGGSAVTHGGAGAGGTAGDRLLGLEVAGAGCGGAPWREAPGAGLACYGCMRPLGGPETGGTAAVAAAAADDVPGMVLRCQLCRQLFCFECDAFIHESLHNCPGCECGGAAAAPPRRGGDGGGGVSKANGKPT